MPTPSFDVTMSAPRFLVALCVTGIAAVPAALAQEPAPARSPSSVVAADTQLRGLDSLHLNYLRRREGTCVGDPTCRLYNVSIAELLAHPGLFHGKRVRLIGFLHLEFEGTAVYMSREDERHGLTRNGLWVDFRNKEVWNQADVVNDRYVLLEGTFDAENPGHMGLWSGALKDIYRVVGWR
jgi:hypothetical protein